ncbi:MAG: hypothetical protein GY953_03675, partial [bacterium]|nr:hypothetical protein [bacterium]
GRVADTINTPPLDVAGLREEWAAIRAEVASIPSPNLPSADLVRRRWDDLRAEAATQQRSVFQLSSLIAISTAARLPENFLRLGRSAGTAAKRTGGLFAGAWLDHYQATLKDIHETGYLAYWIREFRPYLKGAAEQFSPSKTSFTQRWLGR